MAGKCSEDSRKKQKGVKTMMPHDWLKLYMMEWAWLKGSDIHDITKGSMASEWNQLFMLQICGAKYSLLCCICKKLPLCLHITGAISYI